MREQIKIDPIQIAWEAKNDFINKLGFHPRMIIMHDYVLEYIKFELKETTSIKIDDNRTARIFGIEIKTSLGIEHDEMKAY